MEEIPQPHCKDLARSKGCQFDWRRESGFSIQASKRALGQAVGNLVDSAIKLSLPGSTITFGLTPTHLEVAYLADPIAEIDRDRIFERFCRTPAVLSRRWIWFGPHYRSRNEHRNR